MDTDLAELEPGKNGCFLYILCDMEIFYHDLVVVIEIMFTFVPSKGFSPREGQPRWTHPTEKQLKPKRMHEKI